ncbi:unnamed protein product [Symbiodinium sp. CCMP2456]|nr:unnamed protein product [Symbiodinium sp. CCMP2456]
MEAIEERKNMGAAFRTPSRKRTTYAAMTPATKTSNKEDEQAPIVGTGGTSELPKSDPYLASPSVSGGLPLPSSATRSRSRMTPRMPIKCVGRTPKRTTKKGSLADKLDARRAAADAAGIHEIEEESDEEQLLNDLAATKAQVEIPTDVISSIDGLLTQVIAKYIGYPKSHGTSVDLWSEISSTRGPRNEVIAVHIGYPNQEMTVTIMEEPKEISMTCGLWTKEISSTRGHRNEVIAVHIGYPKQEMTVTIMEYHKLMEISVTCGLWTKVIAKYSGYPDQKRTHVDLCLATGQKSCRESSFRREPQEISSTRGHRNEVIAVHIDYPKQEMTVTIMEYHKLMVANGETLHDSLKTRGRETSFTREPKEISVTCGLWTKVITKYIGYPDQTRTHVDLCFATVQQRDFVDLWASDQGDSKVHWLDRANGANSRREIYCHRGNLNGEQLQEGTPGDFFDLWLNLKNSSWVVLGRSTDELGTWFLECGRALSMVITLTLVGVLTAHLCWCRPLAMSSDRTRVRPTWAKLLLAFSVLQVGQAGGDVNEHLGTWRQPSDVELWRAGQLTRREQAVRAEGEFILSQPLESGGLLPTTMYAGGPPTPLPQPPEALDTEEPPVDPFEFVEDLVPTHHISFWICAPFHEPESLDVAVSFPQTMNQIQDTIWESIRVLDTHWFVELLPTVPQISGAYGSFIMLPRWALQGDKKAVVLDASGIDKGTFAFYISSPITRFAVLNQLALDTTMELDVFVGGSFAPLQEDEGQNPSNGCLIKVLRRGEVVDWQGRVEDRLHDPALWNPETDHPAHVGSRFIEFQTTDETHLHPLQRQWQQGPMNVAVQTFGLNPENVWLRSPTERPKRLYKAGHRVYSLVAVLNESRHRQATTSIVFFDLRPIGHWVQWLAVDGERVHPGEYLEGLQLPFYDGFTLVVYGGQRHGDQGYLTIKDGDVLEVHLQPDGEVTPNSPTYSMVVPLITPRQHDLPQDTDLETWTSGQRTVREQMAEAWDQHVLSNPLERTPGEADVPRWTVPVAEPAGPGTMPTMEDLGRHVTIWVAAPYYEAEVLDVDLPLPLRMSSFRDAMRGALTVIPDALDDYVATVPQIDGHYASFVAQPVWLDDAGKFTLIMDTRMMEGTVFAFFTDMPLDRQTIVSNLPDYGDAAFDIYYFGEHQPLADGLTIQPIPGGVIKIVPAGALCEWADELTPRLQQPDRWLPHPDPPEAHPGLHTVYQSANDQVIEEIDDDDIHPLEEAAAEALSVDYECRVYLPNERMPSLAHGGRSIWEQVAVLPASEDRGRHTTVVFLDLRQLGFFPQWVQVDEPYFTPSDYIDGLQIQGVQDWTITVIGGVPRGPDQLEVRHQEVLTFTLNPPESSPEDDDMSSGDNDGDSSSSSSATDPLPHSSDFSSGPPNSPSGGPYGPPPPQPVDRSRSPRRRLDGAETTKILALADHCPVPVYDMDKESLRLQPEPTALAEMLRPWPPSWMQFDVGKFLWKPATMMALASVVPWTALITSAGEGDLGPEVHVYTDGSFSETAGASGAAALVLLQRGNLTAVLGGFGTRILGDPDTLWKADLPPALMAEEVAIILALLWIGQATWFLRFAAATIHFDCQAAGRGADGTWAPCDGVIAKAHELEMFVKGLLGNNLYFEFVKAHEGHPWNEAVDVMAKAASQDSPDLPRPPHENCGAYLRGTLSWTAVTNWRQNPRALPLDVFGGFQWGPADQAEGCDVCPEESVPTVATVSSKTSASLTFRALSVNLQGLKGKHAYIEEQLSWRGVQIACIQETKDYDGMVHTKKYLRLAAPSDAHWGTAIWLSKEYGAFTVDGAAVIVTEADVEIKCSTPRLLFVIVKKAGMMIALFSGHSPHGGQAEERLLFYSQLSSLLMPLHRADVVVGGIDANARPPSDFAQVTGARTYGDSDQAGEQLVQVLHEHGMWLPATFHEYHWGSDVTYQHPCGPEHRIDFLALGGCSACNEVASRVATDFDTANKLEDHRAVEVEVGMTTGPLHDARKLYRPQFDRTAMRSDAGRAIICTAMQKYVPPDWGVGVDRRCQHLQDYLVKVMEEHFPVSRGGMRATYISPEVWDWRNAKLHLKSCARHRRKMWEAALAAAVSWWAGADIRWTPRAVAKHDVLYQLVASAITFATERIKKKIRQDKQAFLQSLVYDGLSSVGQILQRLKKSGVGGKRNRVRRLPLPKLVQEDGVVASSRHQHDAVWLRHFAAQEYGEILPASTFLEQASRLESLPADFQWVPEDLPSLLEIEGCLRAVPFGKSPGLDNVPGELLRAAPAQMAAAIQPLFVKALVQLKQPVQWRGGILYAAWKGAGRVDDPNSHRSLFVSSTVGKSFHKLVRGRGQAALQTVLHGLHLGSRKDAPIGFASMYLLSFLRANMRRKRCYGALFVDTKAAYYRVVRQVAVGALDKDEDVARLLSHFGLQPEDMHHLLRMVQAGGLMREAGNQESVTAACADFHRATWFVSSYSAGSSLATTRTGSRPGESWADAIFSYVYARAVGTLVERADGESLLSYVEHNRCNGIFPGPPAQLASIARDGTWADDSVLPVEDPCPQRLVLKPKRLCPLTIATLEEFGLQPNLKPGKTSAVIHLQGKGAQAARKMASKAGKPVLWLEDLRVEVPVVPHYVHLGGAIDAKLTMKLESRRRLALMGSAYDQGKKLLFQNATIPLQVRAKLFEVAVRSTLFNLSLWIPEGETWNSLAGGYARCLRRLLATTFKGDQLFKIPLVLVHVRLFSAIVLNGPDILWAVLQQEQTWFDRIQRDLLMLKQFDDSWPPVSLASWGTWTNYIVQQPKRFKAAVKRMLRARHSADMEKGRDLVALWTMRRMLGYPEADVLPGGELWSCRACRRSFRSKGGLGAHMFKVHGRKAAFRSCATGTVCAACGTQYWSEMRLATHLRDSPWCTNVLRTRGHAAESLQPGFGSTLARQRAAEQFTPAPTTRVQEPLPDVDDVKWSNEATEAYKEVCFELFERATWTSMQAVLAIIVAVFDKHPLYSSEEIELCDYIRSEIQELAAGHRDLLWDETSRGFVMEALEQAAIRPSYGTVKDTREGQMSWKEFEAEVDEFQWDQAVSDKLLSCGTHEPASETLCIDWEAGKPMYSDTGDFPAATLDSSRFIPIQLRTVWQKVLQGTVQTISASESFWGHPLAAPFAALRGKACN